MEQHRDDWPLRTLQVVGEQTQRGALAGAGNVDDEREADLAHEMLFDLAAEAVHGGSGHQALTGRSVANGFHLSP